MPREAPGCARPLDGPGVAALPGRYLRAWRDDWNPNLNFFPSSSRSSAGSSRTPDRSLGPIGPPDLSTRVLRDESPLPSSLTAGPNLSCDRSFGARICWGNGGGPQGRLPQLPREALLADRSRTGGVESARLRERCRPAPGSRPRPRLAPGEGYRLGPTPSPSLRGPPVGPRSPQLASWSSGEAFAGGHCPT